MSLEADLRAGLARTVASVVPQPDPMGRLRRRRARRNRRRVAIGAAGLITALTLAVTLPWRPVSGPSTDQPGQLSAVSRWLIESPTRGGLARDQALVEQATRLIRADREDELARVKVLFIGDLPSTRLIAWVRYDDWNGALSYAWGPAGTPVPEMMRQGRVSNLPVEPYLVFAGGTGPSHGYAVGLAPDGCRFASSATGVVMADGSVRRTWTEAPTEGWIERATPQPAERWRVTCGTVVRYEGPIQPPREPDPRPGADVLVPATPKPGIGGSDGAAAPNADDLLRTIAARDGLPIGVPRQLWSGVLPGTGSPAALAIAPSSGGGVAAVLVRPGKVANVSVAFGPKSAHVGPSDDPTVHHTRKDYGLVSTAVSGTANLVAIRIPERDSTRAVWSNRILVVAPPSAATAHLNGTVVALVDGVGVLTSTGQVAGTIVARDHTGSEVARATVTEPDGPSLLGEPIIVDW